MSATGLNPHLRYPVVLFDLGSTLIYFSGDWRTITRQSLIDLVHTLLQAGLKLDAEVFRAQLQARLETYFYQRESELVEHTTGAILRGLLAEQGTADVPEKLIERALQAMYQPGEAWWQLEPETLPVLEQLRQQSYRLGMISNAADDANVQRLVDQAGLRAYFDVILTSAGMGIRKPHPRIFQTALETWQAAPSQAVMVGDTLNADILGAHNLGIFSVWVTRRAAPADNSAHAIRPDAVLENVGELPELLSSMG
jgi:HAD superfamily hydrolase (TIGR01662 family)